MLPNFPKHFDQTAKLNKCIFSTAFTPGGTTYPDLIDESYFLDPSDRDLSKSHDLQRDESSVTSHSKDWDESSVTSHSRDWSTVASHDRDWDESSVTSQDREKKSVTFPDEKAEGSEADVIIDQQVLKSRCHITFTHAFSELHLIEIKI